MIHDELNRATERASNDENCKYRVGQHYKWHQHVTIIKEFDKPSSCFDLQSSGYPDHLGAQPSTNLTADLVLSVSSIASGCSILYFWTLCCVALFNIVMNKCSSICEPNVKSNVVHQIKRTVRSRLTWVMKSRAIVFRIKLSRFGDLTCARTLNRVALYAWFTRGGSLRTAVSTVSQMLLCGTTSKYQPLQNESIRWELTKYMAPHSSIESHRINSVPVIALSTD